MLKIFPQAVNWIKTRFRKLPRKTMEELFKNISDSASPGIHFYIYVLLSSTIATFGLLTDSGPVIIGAMLMAPLMSPIIGIGMASVTGKTNLLRVSFFALLRGAMLAVLLATILTTLNTYLPFIALSELPSEILARTRPTPIDLVIAFAGGLGGAYALSKPNLSAALPGVAISTALMPPLCVIGIGLAINEPQVATGSLLLFLTNAAAIASAAGLVFLLIGFGPDRTVFGTKRVPATMAISGLVTVALLVMLTIVSVQSFRTSSREQSISNVVSSEIDKIGGTQLVSIKHEAISEVLSLDITVRTSKRLTYQEAGAIKFAVEQEVNEPVSLVINQIFIEKVDPYVPTQEADLKPEGVEIRINGLPLHSEYIALAQTPGGPEIARLTLGDPLLYLDVQDVFEGLVWLRVTDADGRIGWIPQIFTDYILTTQ